MTSPTNSGDKICAECRGLVHWSEIVQRFFHDEPKGHRVLQTIAREVIDRGDMEPAGLPAGSDGETHYVSSHHGLRTQEGTRHESGQGEPAVQALDSVVSRDAGDRLPDETDRS